MYVETILSDQAKQLETVLSAVPPKYDEADEILSRNSITQEELSKIAADLIDMCCDEQRTEDLKEIIKEDTTCSYIYKIMQYLFSHGYDPNVLADGGCECAMDSIRFITYPEGLAPRLMRLFMENGADPNLIVDGESVFEHIDFAIYIDEYFSRSTVYCWLVLMAYGGRGGEDKQLPLTMHHNLDVSIFKRYEDYAYYEIIPTRSDSPGYGNWKMLIYDTRYEDQAHLVASYGDVDGEPAGPGSMKYAGNEKQEAAEEEPAPKTNTVSPRPDGVPISEEDFLRKIEKMYSEYAIEDIYCHMELDFRYSSVWVFSEMTSAREYIEYITGKVETLKKNNVVIKTRMLHMKGSGEPCLVLEQNADTEPACLTVKRSERGLIARMDMAPVSFYRLVP